MKQIFRTKQRIKKILPQAFLDWYYFSVPFLGHIVYDDPTKKLRLVGVTGTDGKSSTTFFLAKILEAAGFKTGFSSSVYFGDGNHVIDNTLKMTMPGRWFYPKFLSKLLKNGCQWAVIEVTSEGIKQKRHISLEFDAALITNLKPEHIESHKGFDNYKAAKQTIFKNLKKFYKKDIPKTIIANIDDEHGTDFLNWPADKKVSFGFNQLGANVKGLVIKSDFYSNDLKINCGQDEIVIQSKMGGPFAAENLLAASAGALALGIKPQTIKSALEKITLVPGRFEIVATKPIVIVDYAHTIQALEKLLPYVRKNWSGEIIHVFGSAGGGRDRWKRPLLAELSEKYTTFSIITEENSFDEPFENISKDICAGFSPNAKVQQIPERDKAIEQALKMVKDPLKQLVLVSGKGCEQVIAGLLGIKRPHNDKKSVLWHLGNLSRAS